MTISEAAKLSPRVVQTLNGNGDIWELNDRSTRAVTLANLTADDWEPVYDKIEVEHGSFPWAMYQMIENGMEVRPAHGMYHESDGRWFKTGEDGCLGTAYTFHARFMEARWECRKTLAIPQGD